MLCIKDIRGVDVDANKWPTTCAFVVANNYDSIPNHLHVPTNMYNAS